MFDRFRKKKLIWRKHLCKAGVSNVSSLTEKPVDPASRHTFSNRRAGGEGPGEGEAFKKNTTRKKD